MEYKIKRSAAAGIILEKYTEPKGFFRNTTGPLKVGKIRLDDCTEDMWIQDFLTEEDKVYYMELRSVEDFDFPYRGEAPRYYRGEAPRISIGDKKHIIPVEDRIKFLYESLVSNTNYNYLRIIYINPVLGAQISFYKINKWDFQVEDCIVAFFIKDLNMM